MRKVFKLALTLVIMSCGVYSSYTYADTLEELKALNGDESTDHKSFHGADLSGADLSSISLSYIDLSGANLTNANLTGATLRNIDLTGAKMDNVALGANVIHKTQVIGCNFRDTNLYKATIAGGVSLTDCDFSGSHLDGATFAASNITHCIFDRATAPGGEADYVSFAAATIGNSSFVDASLPYTGFSAATLNDCDMNYATLDNSFFSAATLRNCDLSYVSASGCVLSSATLDHCNLVYSNFSNSDWSCSTMNNCNVYHYNISGCSWVWATQINCYEAAPASLVIH